jgi:hypothetical protein
MSGSLRSPQSRALLAGALVMSLVLGACFLVVQALRSPGDSPYRADPLTDEQTKAQIVDTARQIVTVAELERASGGYMLLSCKNENEPPYQGAADIHFALPSDAVGYFERFAAKMIANGWSEGLPPNQHVVGKTFSKNGVTAIAYRNGDYRRLGIMKIYGECRDMTDHRTDVTAWTDISDQLD